MTSDRCPSRSTDRRSVLQAGAGVLAALGVAGCLGGGGSSDNSTNDSENGSGVESSPTTLTSSEPTATDGPGETGTANGTTTTAIPSVFGSEVEFSGSEMSIPLNTDVTLDAVQLNAPNGDVFATFEPHQYEGSATFTLIEQTSDQLGYKLYPFGTYTAKAVQEDRVVDSHSYDLRPAFSVTGIESQQGLVAITVENIGSAPAPITAARIYRLNQSPGPQEFGGGFVDQDAIVPPEESITVETGLMGFNDVYSIGNNSSVSDYENQYCTGEARPITVSYRVFGEIRETTGSLVFGGGPTEGPNQTIACEEYTINAGANVSANGTNTTGNLSGNLTNETGNLTGANRSTMNNTSNRSNGTGSNLTAENGTSENASMSANQSNSSDYRD